MDTKYSQYYEQVILMMRLLPLVAEENCFALKGGTAINLFFQALPRLSVDIDLVYLPLEDRDSALTNIHDALNRIAVRVEKQVPRVYLQKSYLSRPDALRIIASLGKLSVKIELSPVQRGTVFPADMRRLDPVVEEQFGYVKMRLVSSNDLYAGKFCAALDRQHPRDFFDVKQLIDHHAISDNLRKTFIVYLIGHNRPISELLSPNRKDFTAEFYSAFQGMTRTEVSLDELIATREKLINFLHDGFTNDEKKFLLSFKSLIPKWELLGLANIESLPAVQWKMRSLAKMSSEKRERAINTLEQALYINKGSAL